MKSHDPLLIDTGRGFSVLYNKRQLYNPKEPEPRAVLRAEQVQLQEDTLYIINSPLLFYGVSKITSKLPSGSHIICFELSQDLYKLSKNNIPDNILQLDSISFINSTNKDDIYDKIKKLGIWNFRRVRAINLSGGYALNSIEYKSILEHIDNNIQEYWKNRMTLVHMAPLWIKNIFINLSKLYKEKNIPTFTTFPKTDCPIIVAGAGESLENSISFIKKNRSNFKIIAVDTAVSVLLENEIEPDYIVAVDAQIYNLYDFYNVKDKNIPLFFDITGYPGILSILKSNVTTFISNFANTKLLDRLEKYKLLPKRLPALGSVGITALYIALETSSNYVFFTGLDFSYKIGKSHSNGSPRHFSELITSNRLNPLEQPGIYYSRPLIHTKDKKGNDCISDLILSSYANLKICTFRENKRLKDIGISGLYNGSEFQKTSEISISHNCSCQSISSNEQKTSFLENYQTFIRNELELLKNVYTKTFRYLSAKPDSSSELIQLLKEVDYIYIHFPDKRPYPILESGYLKRILVSCGYYINILERYI